MIDRARPPAVRAPTRRVASGLRLAVVVLVVLASRPAIAAGKRNYVVTVRPASANVAWRAEALQVALTADLADDRLSAHAPVANATTDAAWRAGGVDIVVDVTVDVASLRIELRPLWAGAPASIREVVLLGGDRNGVAGVLRDRMHRLARTIREDEEDTASAVPSVTQVAMAMAALAGVVLLPFAVGLLLRRRPERRPVRRTLVGLVAFGGGAIVIAAVAPTLALVYALGGLAWGAFIAVTVPIVFPPLPGLGRIDGRELAGVLALWIGLVARRAIAVATLYVPVGIVAWLAADALDLAEPVTFALVLPATGLVVRHAVRCAVAVAAVDLDARFVDAADAAAWDAAVRAYVVGYLRRAGLPVDDELLARVRFLPGTSDVMFYGGGLTDTRIVVPRRMLELALSPAGRPHDYAAPRVSTLHWTQWNAGLVMPTEPGVAIATAEQRQPREVPFDDVSEREHIGEPPTLVGVIEPDAFDPRKSYRPSEDPLWLDYDAGEDYDGTDAGDRDFLFGIVVHALGAIQRHAIEPHTLALVARRLRPVDRVAKRLGSDAAGDVHAAIAGARHHLIQYLAWRGDGRADLLTARAYLPELEEASRRALARDVLVSMSIPVIAESPAAAAVALPAPVAIDRAIRARLVRLAPFVRGARARPRPWRRAAIAGAVVAVAGVLAVAVANAVRYHSTYVERMEKAHG